MTTTRQSRLQIASAIMLALIGSAFFNLQPLFLAAAQPVFELSDSQIGWLAAVELTGIALASIMLTLFARHYNYRVAASAGLVAIVAGNTATLYADSFTQLLVTRLVTGLTGDGVVYITAILVLGRLSAPTRAFGAMVFFNMAVTAINMQLLPALFADNIWQGLLMFLVVIAITGLMFAHLLPGTVQSGVSNPTMIRLDKDAAPLLVSVCAFAINLGVVWSYAERLGARAGLSLEEIATYLSYSLPVQAGGALLAALLGTRFGKARPMVLVIVFQLMATCMLVYAVPGREWLFFAGISAWGLSWNLGIVYLLGQAAVMRSSQQTLTLVPCAEAIGVSAGPAIAAVFVSGSHYLPVHVTAVAAIIVSAVFYFDVSRKRVQFTP